MAVAIIAEIPGGSAEQDESFIEELGVRERLAPGARMRIAGPIEGG